MNNKVEKITETQSIVGNTISWIFGIVFLAIGVVNMFWGNDLWFGVFIALLSFIYFLPVNNILRKVTAFSITKMEIVKIIVGIFIIWAAVGLGELFDKVDMMMGQ